MQESRRVRRLKARAAAASSSTAATARSAIGYLRVSTDEQAQHGHGLEGQRRAVTAFAESQGWQLVTLETDAGISGATKPLDRPGFRAAAENSSAGVILVWKFDRLARSILYAVETVAELPRFGKSIRSVTEPIDTDSPMGRTIFAVLSGLAEQEKHHITERTHAGRREKAVKGGFAGGRAPYGYTKDAQGNLAIDQTQADAVRQIFRDRKSGCTLEEIARRLNVAGISGPGGKAWHVGRVAYILDNPKYRGAVEYLFRWNGTDAHVLTDGQHQPII